MRQLAAAGYEQLGQPGKAAERYSEAAAKTTLEGERDQLFAKAARAWAVAGKKDEAIRLWRQIAAKPGNPLENEARIRLGELTAAPAGGAPAG